MQSVTADLEKRIAAGRAWLESGEGLQFAGPSLRGRSTVIHLSSFLDKPRRVERHGLGFTVTIDAGRGPRHFQMNVRIKPRFTDGKKGDSNPYVVTYVVKHTTGADDEIEHEHFSSPSRYTALAGMDDQAWYKHWINRAFQSGRGKFFAEDVLKE